MRMPEYTKDEALAFVSAIRLTLGNKVGFQWLVERLSDLAAYIESLSAENERLTAYLDRAGTRSDYESYCATLPGTALPGDAPEEV